MSGIRKISCDDGCGCYDDLVCDKEDTAGQQKSKTVTTPLMPMALQGIPEGNLTDHNAGSVAFNIAKVVYSEDLTTPAKPKDAEKRHDGGNKWPRND